MRQHAAQVERLVVHGRGIVFALGDVGVDADETATRQRGANDFDHGAHRALAHETMGFALAGQVHALACQFMRVARAILATAGIEVQQVFQRGHLVGEERQRKLQHRHRQVVDGQQPQIGIEQRNAHGHMFQHVPEQPQLLLKVQGAEKMRMLGQGPLPVDGRFLQGRRKVVCAPSFRLCHGDRIAPPPRPRVCPKPCR